MNTPPIENNDANPPTEASTGDDSNRSVWVPALKQAGWAFASAAAVLIVAYVLLFERIHPEFVPFLGGKEVTAITAPGSELIPVSAGSARVDGESLVIEDFNGDEAVVVLARSFKAEDYPFIKVNLHGFTRYSKLKVLWRQTEDIETTHSLELNRSGDEVTQVAMVYGEKGYRGEIADIALLFYDGPALGFENNDDVDIVIESIELRPFSMLGVFEQIYEDWTNPPLWQGYSNNIVRGIHPNGMLFPNAVANLLVVTGVALTGLWRLFRRRFGETGASRNAAQTLPILPVALSLCLYGWAFNDILRWHWRIEQLIDTHERYAGLPLEERIRNNPIRCARFPKDCKADLLPYF